jgi:Haem-NO-binding
MKGTIVKAAEKLVISLYGVEVWEKVLVNAGLDADHFFLIRDDIEDELVMKIITSISVVGNLTMDQVFAAYAKYWVHTYTPEVYPSFKFDTAKDFIMNIQPIHNVMTENVPNAKPPRFDYEWKSKKELLMTYTSARGLIDLVILMMKEIGVRYKEELEVKKVSDTQFTVIFK